MAEVTLIDFSHLNRLALSTFTEVGPQFSIQDSRLRPVIEKAKKLSTLQNMRSISVASAFILVKFNRVQPPLFYMSTVLLEDPINISRFSPPTNK